MKLPVTELFNKSRLHDRDVDDVIKTSDRDMKEYLEYLEKNDKENADFAEEVLCDILERIWYVLTVDKYREIKKKNKK